MTAAIPPACCAGADGGKIYAQLHRVGRAHGGDFACADSGASGSGSGAKLQSGRVSNTNTYAYADADADAHADAHAHAHAYPYAYAYAYPYAHSYTYPNAHTDTHAVTFADADRRGFQRRIDRRSGQTTLQPDDHQPGTRHGAARCQRTGQLQRLR